MLEADRWDSVLTNVRGTIVRGTERVSATRLLDALDVGPDPALRQKVGKRLVGAMRRAGWSGPKPMRIPGENGHASGANGYWRVPSRLRQPDVPVGRDVDVPVAGDVEGLSDDLPSALEEVTRLGLRMLARVLRTPLDVTDASLTRSQVTAAIGAVNAQLRADEQRLRAKVQGDVLERLLKIIAEEKAKRELRRKGAVRLTGGTEAGAEPPDDAGEAS
jgi:hypothetical protein